MQIGIIGSGNVGGTLGRLWAAKGHTIQFGSRDPQSEKLRKLLKEIGPKASASSIREAASWAEVVVLATPWPTTHEAIEAAGNLAGKVLIDCTNPLDAKTLELVLGFTTSGAEQVAAWAPGARVVKDFNTLGAALFATPVLTGQQISMFLCGNDAQAKAVAARLTAELGFDVVDCGPLSAARLLEPLCALWLKLGPGADWNHAFKLLRKQNRS